MSACHVLVSQPLMAAGSSTRFPRKPLEGGLTCGPLSHPQFCRPTSGPDVPRLSREPVCAPHGALGPRPSDRPSERHFSRTAATFAWRGAGGRGLSADGRSLGLNSEGRSWLL